MKRPRLKWDLLMRNLLVRDLLQLCRLERSLPALYAFIAVKKLGEILGLVSVDPDNDPGLTPGLLE